MDHNVQLAIIPNIEQPAQSAFIPSHRFIAIQLKKNARSHSANSNHLAIG
jgi:hypothetical protein